MPREIINREEMCENIMAYFPELFVGIGGYGILELTERFRTSHKTINDCLQRLVKQGRIERVPNRNIAGSYVYRRRRTHE